MAAKMNSNTKGAIVAACAVYSWFSVMASCYFLKVTIDHRIHLWRDVGFMALACLVCLLLGAIYPLSLPVYWIARSCIRSDRSYFGFNWSQRQAKRQAKKQAKQQQQQREQRQREQWVEMGRMERGAAAQREEHQNGPGQKKKEQDDTRRYEEARERILRMRESLRGGPTRQDDSQHPSELSENPVERQRRYWGASSTSSAPGTTAKGDDNGEGAVMAPQRVLTAPAVCHEDLSSSPGLF